MFFPKDAKSAAKPHPLAKTCKILNARYDISCNLETQLLSERERVALGSRCLTRIHFKAK